MEKITIFVSYRHLDSEWILPGERAAQIEGPNKGESLLNYISDRCKSENVIIWSDHHLRAGDNYTPIIMERIRKSDIALLILSDNFAFSKYIMDTELPEILKNKLKIVPVLVDPITESGKAKLKQKIKDESFRNYLQTETPLRTLFEKSINQFNNKKVEIVNLLTQTIIPVCKEEKELYTSILENNNIKLCDSYLKKYPEGRYIPQVKKKREEYLLKAERISAYQKAIQSKAIHEYDLFLETYKSGEDVEKIEKLKQQYLTLQQEKETKAFLALNEKEPQTFLVFLEKHTDSKRYPEVKERWEQIKKREKKQYKKVVRKNTVGAYDEYILKNLNGLFLNEVIAKRDFLRMQTSKGYKIKLFCKKRWWLIALFVLCLSYFLLILILPYFRSIHFDPGTSEDMMEFKDKPSLPGSVSYGHILGSYPRFELIEETSEKDTYTSQGIEYYKNGQKEQAKDYFLKGTEISKSPVSMYNMAVYTYSRNYRDSTNIVKWLTLAAKHNNPQALYNLPLFIYKDQYNNLSENELYEIIGMEEKALELGYTKAHLVIGSAYRKLRKEEEALSHFIKGAEAGWSKCAVYSSQAFYRQNDYANVYKYLQMGYDTYTDRDEDNRHAYDNIVSGLAACYSEGIGCEKSIPATFELLSRYEETGYDKNTSRIRCILIPLYLHGKGTSKNEEKAFELAEKEYRHNLTSNPELNHNLAHMYLKGVGTPVQVDSALNILKRYIQKTIYSHESDICGKMLCTIGHIYLDSLYGYYDLDSARVYFQQSAERLNTKAMNALGYIYTIDETDVTKDYKLAESHFKKAIEKESSAQKDEKTAAAYYNLGVMYYYGVPGVKKDKEMGEINLYKAARRGHKEAQKILNRKKLLLFEL